MARSFKSFRTERREKKIAGVCATLGNQFGVDPTILRVGFAAFAIIVSAQVAILGYLGLAIWFAAKRKQQGNRDVMSDFDRMEYKTRVRPSIHAMRTQLDPIDRRMMAIDAHIATPNHELAREIEALREDK